jgi:hypothetical protein
VAFDTGGAPVVGEWIRAAQPDYPCLIDTRHVVAGLYGMTNVPSAVWIDEAGCIVRAAENCGSSDAWRFGFDRDTGEMGAGVAADATTRHEIYFAAVRDWADKGIGSCHVPREDSAAGGTALGTDEARAVVIFRLATHLRECGHVAAARKWFEHAADLSPRGWRMKRELWTLDDPGNLYAGDFMAEVDALGEEHYYDPPAIDGMPQQATKRAFGLANDT